jgi:hypothetical protein
MMNQYIEKSGFRLPMSKRPKLNGDLIKKREEKANALDLAAKKANKLRKVNRDMKDWTLAVNLTSQS